VSLEQKFRRKYGISIERHLTELAKLRDDAQKKGAWSAAINAEVARGKAGGLYVDQKLIMTGSIDNLSEQELESRMKDILKDHKDIMNGTSEDIIEGKAEDIEEVLPGLPTDKDTVN